MNPYAIVQAAEDITIGAASAQSTAAPVGTTHARLVATTSCRFLTGVNPTALATSTLIVANTVPEFVKISPGDKIAAIQEAAAGKLSVTFVRVVKL